MELVFDETSTGAQNDVRNHGRTDGQRIKKIKRNNFEQR